MGLGKIPLGRFIKGSIRTRQTGEESRNCSPEVGAAAGATEQEKEATAAAPPGKDSAETGELRQRSRNALRSSTPAGFVGLGLGPGPSVRQRQAQEDELLAGIRDLGKE